MAHKHDTHFIPSPFKVVTQYENAFVRAWNNNMAEAVAEVLEYIANATAVAIKTGQVGGASILEEIDDTEVEKAHKVGDLHPNGKWVWTEYKPGKFDWRRIKKNATEKKQKVEGGSKEVDDFMDKVKIFNNKYTDISKVSVIKTPKGNWDVSYDGHRLGIINADQLSEKTAKKNGWLRRR